MFRISDVYIKYILNLKLQDLDFLLQKLIFYKNKQYKKNIKVKKIIVEKLFRLLYLKGA